jgi:hypothetical protein
MRVASADRNGRPHGVPTGFNIDGEKGVVEIGGHIHPDRGQKRLYLTNLASDPSQPSSSIDSTWRAWLLGVRGLST